MVAGTTAARFFSLLDFWKKSQLKRKRMYQILIPKISVIIQIYFCPGRLIVFSHSLNVRPNANFLSPTHPRRRDSSIGMTKLRAGRAGLDTQQRKETSLFSTEPRVRSYGLALGSTQPQFHGY